MSREFDPNMAGGAPNPEVGGGHFMTGLTEGKKGVFAAGIAGAGALLAGAAIMETTPVSAHEPDQEIHRTIVKTPGEAAVDFDSAHVRIRENHRTVSKLEYQEDLAAGRCDYKTSEEMKEMGVQTAMTGGYAYDARPSHLCDSDGDGDYDYRGECGNAVKVSQPKPEAAEANLWVKSKNNFRAKVKAVSLAIDKEGCRIQVGDSYSYSYSYARAKAVATGYLRVKNSAKLGVKQLNRRASRGIRKISARLSRRSNARLDAKTKAFAYADAKCEEVGGTVVPPEEVEQHKDPTNTQVPPADAPGTNPAPSPDDPTPGGHECYSEETGQDVPPRQDGTCPVGSVGA